MPQGNKKITMRKILATNKKKMVCIGSLIQPALFKKILAINDKASVFKIYPGTQ